MIKLYPVLVSNSVSKNIIPGILKSVERFALIYKLDNLSDEARKSAGISLRKVGKKMIMKESDEEIAAFLANEILQEQGWNPTQRHSKGTKQGQQGSGSSPFTYVGSTGGSRRTPTSQRQKQRQKQYQQQRQNVTVNVPPTPTPTPRSDEEEATTSYAKEVGKRAAYPADATISIDKMDMNSIMLEPTWMKIDRVTKGGAKFTSVLGVKAVPVMVKSDASLAQLLTFDKNVGRLMHLILKAGRWTTGILYRLYARTIQKMVDPDPQAISGDPYKDIVLKRTILSSKNVNDVFLVLNQADLEEDFAIRAKGIRKLMNLGWQSFCIADDVNRRLTFCMKEFRGMCQMLPYTMIYQSLDQAKVFEDLEDVRRSSTSLFRSKIPMKKVFAESMAQKKLEEFSADLFEVPSQETVEFLNELAYIDESFATVAKKVLSTPKEFLTRFFKGNVKIPTISFEKALKIGRKVDPQFIKAHALAKRVLSNSLKIEGLNEKMLDWSAFSIVIRAKSLPGKDLMSKTRDALMSIVPAFRKAIRKAQSTTMNIPPQHRVEAVFGLITTFVIIAALGFFYTWTLLVSLKIKPYVGEAITTIAKYISMAFVQTKSFMLKLTEKEPQEITAYWRNIFAENKQFYIDLIAPYKKSFEEFLETKTGEGGAVDNLKDVLKEQYDLNFQEIGAIFLLGVIGLMAMRWIMRPPK